MTGYLLSDNGAALGVTGVRQTICYRTMELHLSNRCMTGYWLSDYGAARE